MQCLAQCRSKAALQCCLVSPYWPVCVSECSCVRTVSDLLGEFSHFSAATWLSCLPSGQSRAGQTCICRSQHIHIWERLFLQITQSHLAELLSEQNCSCRSKSKHLGTMYHFKNGHFWGILCRSNLRDCVCILDSHFWESSSEQNILPIFICKSAPNIWPAGAVGDLWGEFSRYSELQVPRLCVQIEPHITDQSSCVNVQMYNREPCRTGQYSSLDVQIYDAGSSGNYLE